MTTKELWASAIIGVGIIIGLGYVVSQPTTSARTAGPASGPAHISSVACASQNDFSKLREIAATKDLPATQAMMMGNGGPCFPFAANSEVYVVDTDGGMTKIRIAGTTIELWTASALVQ